MSRLLALCLALSVPVTAQARPLSVEPPVRGVAVAQRFLPGGASVVTTPTDRVCLVSRRIDIAASEYRDPDGSAVAFADVIRSPATVTQAIAGGDGVISFRVQLKFSPDREAPLWLDLPGGRNDVADLLEPSGDSLLIAGDLAQDMARAFAEDARPALVSRSGATGRTVTDRLDPPDLAALGDCVAGLDADTAAGGVAADPATPAEVPLSLVRAVFSAEPTTETIASPGVLQACGMSDRPETLHLGRLSDVTGFISHTDKVFVAFSRDGQVERVYIPGIYDADLRGAGQGMLRVSRAADGNVPAAANTVSGCIGAEAMAVCQNDLGGGLHALTACPDDGIPDLMSSRELVPSERGNPFAGPLPPWRQARLLPPIGGGGGGGGTSSRPPVPPGGTPDDPEPPTIIESLVLTKSSSMRMSGDEAPPNDPPTNPPADPPSPVPLPAGLWLLLTALGGLAWQGASRSGPRSHRG